MTSNKRFMRFQAAVAASLGLMSTTVSATDPNVARGALNTTFADDVETTLALSAAPAHLRDGAAVYLYGAHGYSKTRDGSNGFTCLLNRDAFLYGSTAFKPTCWDPEGATSYVPVMLRVGALLAAGRTSEDIRADIDGGFRDGRFRRPRRTGIAYMLAGDVDLAPQSGLVIRTAFPGHYMIYAPGVTNADIGHSPAAANGNPSVPFIFALGAGAENLAYIITAPDHAHLVP
jgi:hypothetical protein